MSDKLEKMWKQQEEFMYLLQKKRNFPEFPVDLTSKEGQRFIKEISYECADELHEARLHLKNSKKHRLTNLPDIDEAAYIEELSDTLHYFFEICIASGVSMKDLFEMYIMKGEINKNRINNGY